MFYKIRNDVFGQGTTLSIRWEFMELDFPYLVIFPRVFMHVHLEKQNENNIFVICTLYGHSGKMHRFDLFS